MGVLGKANVGVEEGGGEGGEGGEMRLTFRWPSFFFVILPKMLMNRIRRRIGESGGEIGASANRRNVCSNRYLVFSAKLNFFSF